jgi:hypothetical protein
MQRRPPPSAQEDGAALRWVNNEAELAAWLQEVQTLLTEHLNKRPVAL